MNHDANADHAPAAGERERLLHELAAAIIRSRLATPARLLLDTIEPVSFLASQMALFTSPLVPRSRWRDYVAALEDESSWKALRNIVAGREC